MKGELPETVYDETDVIPMWEGFRFSASYASRYHKCHGSANLQQAIPGFEYPERNDDGWKGVGTQLHEIFAVGVSDGKDLRLKAKLLRDLSGERTRLKLLHDKKAFIVWWFMPNKSAPPIDFEVLARGMIYQVPVRDSNANPTGEMREKAVEPRYVVAMAEAFEYVADLLDEMDDDVKILVEQKRTADWLSTAPKTTVDLILMDAHRMEVLDLKMGDVPVDATNNTQLMYYAWTFGAANYEAVTLHIMQRNNFNLWEVKVSRLHEWSNELKESERAILSGDVKLNPGSHCTFCPANPRARSDKGNKSCPAMLELLYGERDKAQEEADVLEGD